MGVKIFPFENKVVSVQIILVRVEKPFVPNLFLNAKPRRKKDKKAAVRISSENAALRQVEHDPSANIPIPDSRLISIQREN